jgi:RNA polymerase sigma-70 factor (ECF subfamily)
MRGFFPPGRRAVERLVADHGGRLYRYAYRLTGCPTDAEDLVQETFARALERFGQLRDPEKARGWLYAILRNAYLQRCRDERVGREVPLDAAGDLPGPPEGPLPEVEPERLQQALNELPEPFRTPVILFYFEDFSYRDIAEHLDVPVGTVMSRLARAKAHLRQRLVPLPVSAGRGRLNDGL